MERRRLGSGGLEVSAIGLGCMGMSTAYGEPDDDESIATIRLALDSGVDFLDTSDAYANGVNETLVGRAIAGRRREVVLASKFGNIRLADGTPGANGRPEHVVAACDASLARLRVDEIDLYYQHRVDADVPIEETVGAMSRLVDAGKVRFLGLSEAGPETIRRAHATHPIAALQTEYSLWTRDAEAELLPLCRQLGIGYVAYSPLGRAFLTARIRAPGDLGASDRRHQHPRFEPENMERNVALLGPLEEIAAARSCTAAQVALAWVLAQGSDIVPIPGTKRRRWLEENARAVAIELDPSELARLDAAFAPGITAGDRYPPGQMRLLGR